MFSTVAAGASGHGGRYEVTVDEGDGAFFDRQWDVKVENQDKVSGGAEDGDKGGEGDGENSSREQEIRDFVISFLERSEGNKSYETPILKDGTVPGLTDNTAGRALLQPVLEQMIAEGVVAEWKPKANMPIRLLTEQEKEARKKAIEIAEVEALLADD